MERELKRDVSTIYMRQNVDYISYMKCILLLGMLFGHVLVFVYEKDLDLVTYRGTKYFIIAILAEYFHLITFSGYFFCFGYLCNLVYFNSEDLKKTRNKILNSSWRMLVGFYISAFSFKILVYPGINWEISQENIINILILKDIPGFSEFLISYFALMILIYLFFPIFKNIFGIRGIFLLLLSLFLFVLSYIVPYDKIDSRLGLYIGSTKFSSFPVLLYFPYYLLGGYFSQNKKNILNNRWLVSLLALGTIIYLNYIYIYGISPSRFPPSFIWLIGGLLFVYIYFFICFYFDKWISKINCLKGLSNFMIELGQNTFYYLILSNFFLFAYGRIFSKQGLTFTLIIFLIIILVPYYLLKIARPLKRN